MASGAARRSTPATRTDSRASVRVAQRRRIAERTAPPPAGGAASIAAKCCLSRRRSSARTELPTSAGRAGRVARRPRPGERVAGGEASIPCPLSEVSAREARPLRGAPPRRSSREIERDRPDRALSARPRTGLVPPASRPRAIRSHTTTGAPQLDHERVSSAPRKGQNPTLARQRPAVSILRPPRGRQTGSCSDPGGAPASRGERRAAARRIAIARPGRGAPAFLRSPSDRAPRQHDAAARESAVDGNLRKAVPTSTAAQRVQPSETWPRGVALASGEARRPARG